MRRLAALVAFVLLSGACWCRSTYEVEHESVVSVYTTQATTSTSGTGPPLDVYQQIANNIAERITSPIYRFLGIGKNKTDDKVTTKRPWGNIELLDEMPEDVNRADLKPVDNDISDDRDVEELSAEALKKIDKKPEKLTLFSSYLPVIGRLERNDTVNEIDDIEDPFDFDDEEEQPREGGFIYVLELLGSIIQLAWGAFTALFRPSNTSS